MILNQQLRRFNRLCSMGGLLVLSAVLAFGQGRTASIRGVVTDSSSAIVPGAHVSVKNTQTGVTVNPVTDTDGRYVAANLPIGQYEVQIQAQGFQTAVRQGINLTVGEQLDVNVALVVGQMATQVAVQESAAQLDTETSTVAGLINQSQMRDLPLNGRNFEQLIALTPGVVPVTNASSSAYIGRSQTYSYGGARPVGQEEMIDGQNIQDFWMHGSGAAVLGTSLGVDADRGSFKTYTSTSRARSSEAQMAGSTPLRDPAATIHPWLRLLFCAQFRI